jgi:hypothetical protein
MGAANSLSPIAVPKQAIGAVEIDLLERGSPHVEARTLLYLDACSGAVLSSLAWAPDAARGP